MVSGGALQATRPIPCPTAGLTHPVQRLLRRNVGQVQRGNAVARSRTIGHPLPARTAALKWRINTGCREQWPRGSFVTEMAWAAIKTQGGIPWWDVWRGGGKPCVTFRLVVAPLRGPGQSPVLPFACCVGSLRSVGRCGRCSCWCCFRIRGAPWLVCRGCAEWGRYPPPPLWGVQPMPSHCLPDAKCEPQWHV